MKKNVSFILCLFLLCGLFIAMFSSVSAELVENTWHIKTPMSKGRNNLGVVTVDGKIYAIGGYSDGEGTVGTNERYDPVTDKWVTLTSMPTPRSCFAIVAYESKI
jgi:hypothetical protein